MTRRDLPPYVYKRMSKGRAYYRFMRGGVERQVDPNAPDFWTVYADLMGGQAIQIPRQRTFDVLIAAYKESRFYKQRAPRTRKDYDRVLARISERMGDKDPALVRRVHVFNWQSDMNDDNSSPE